MGQIIRKGNTYTVRVGAEELIDQRFGFSEPGISSFAQILIVFASAKMRERNFEPPSPVETSFDRKTGEYIITFGGATSEIAKAFLEER